MSMKQSAIISIGAIIIFAVCFYATFKISDWLTRADYAYVSCRSLTPPESLSMPVGSTTCDLAKVR